MNHKAIIRLWLIVVLAGLSLLPTLPLQAQEPGLTEAFDDPALPGWERSPGVAVVDDVLRVEPHNFAFHGGEWEDLTLVVRVRRSGEGEIVVSYRASDAGAYHLVLGGNFVVLQRETGGTVTELDAAAPVSIPTIEWFQLGVTATGGEHTIMLGNEPALTVVDPDPLPPGGIAFEVLGEATAEFDDLTLTASGIAPQLEISPTPETPPETQASAAPADQSLTWVRTGGPLGGLGYDVRMRPDNPNIMYVTDAWAGVFKSTDGGQTWFPSNEGITTRTGDSGDAIPVFSLTIDPHNHDIIWAGTQFQRGIFKSEDGGQTWTKLDNGVVESEGITFRGFTVDPRSSEVVYAAGEISSWAWNGQPRSGREFDMTQGVVYKTTDGGQNWTAVWRGDNLARYVWIDPRDPDVIYVSTGIFDREAANSVPDSRTPGGEGILKSTDGGQTWTHANNGLENLYVGTLFMHPENPDVLLAGTGNNQYYDAGGVYLSTDGGASWKQTLQGDIIESVEFALSDSDIAYAGSAEAVYRSQDGGRTWERVSGGEAGWGPPGVRAGFPIDFQVDPRDPNRIFTNNYGGGNFLSADGGRTWTVASTGYTGAQVRDIAVDPATGRVFAATRSGIFSSSDGGSEWVGLSYPPAASLEWYVVTVDPMDSQSVLAANNWNGVILQSHMGGQNWHPVSQRPGAMRSPELAEGMSWRAIVFAPSEPATVYAGASAFLSAGTFDNQMPAGGVYVSRDGGATWTEANDALSQDANVTALAVDPHDPQVVYAATGNHGLLKSTDGGNSWTPINQGLLGSPTALSVAVHPSESSLVYAGLAFAGLYRSQDGGATWQPSAAGLNPEASVSDIVFDPITPQVMYAADRFSGVYRSGDGGATWLPINNGLRTRTVNALAISSDGQHLYAATEGEGVFRVDLSGQPPAPVSSPVLQPTATPRSAPMATLQPAATPTPAPSTFTPRPVPTTTSQPTVVPTPEPSGNGGFCGGAAAIPLALVTLVVIRVGDSGKLKRIQDKSN